MRVNCSNSLKSSRGSRVSKVCCQKKTILLTCSDVNIFSSSLSSNPVFYLVASILFQTCQKFLKRGTFCPVVAGNFFSNTLRSTNSNIWCLQDKKKMFLSCKRSSTVADPLLTPEFDAVAKLMVF